MSDYIIHNINLVVNPALDFDEIIEPEKPVTKFPNYYIGKIIGEKGNELSLKRTRRGEGEEHVPNCVLRNDNGIALIRVHNKEDLTIYDLPERTESEVNDCVGVPQSSYPYGYVVVDWRDGKCQVAIEKTSAWDSKTVTIKNSLETFFNEKLTNRLGITTTIKEKSIATEFEKFIDERTIDDGDVIESFTFQYVNTKRNPTARIPEYLTEEMDMHTKILEIYGAISGTTTMNMGNIVDNDKLKKLSTVVAMCSDNAFDLNVKFRDYGVYTCNENILAKFPMNEVVISHYKNYCVPEIINSFTDLMSWLDDVFYAITKGKNEKEIPTKPM